MLSQEFRTGCPWELLYADDLFISADSLEELVTTEWKIKVNTGKTKLMISGRDFITKEVKKISLCGVGRN